ncbi:hypothetical protein RhiirA4_472905 [Rhizophagus irregularis]|uniref:Uncharacterized protein n=1 Tax=Rhizophagus irregularis TaxID=588596 RepID=A0A2I1H5R3_9GLOM|nr:hypothetical protein RhiirA4_472905 [Rhizophagus irregularis]
MESPQEDLYTENITPKESTSNSKAILRLYHPCDLPGILCKGDDDYTIVTPYRSTYSQPAAFVLSENRWYCNKHLCPSFVVPFGVHEKQKIPNNPNFYHQHANYHAKEIHSKHLESNMKS